MASYRDQLSLPLFFVQFFFFSLQIHARQGSFFSTFMHYRNDRKVDVTEPKEPLSQAPVPAPETIEITPAPTPLMVADRGDAYGLYGRDSSRFVSQTQETPAAVVDVRDELPDEDLFGESYKTGFSKTRPTHYNDNGYYTNNYQNDQFYRNGDSENSDYPNNYKGYSYPKVYHNNEFYNNRANSHNSNNNNGYYQDREKQGMSDTRFVENGEYYYDVKGENNGAHEYDDETSSGKESTKVGEVYYQENNKSPYEFDTMEEYEKQQESQGYVP